MIIAAELQMQGNKHVGVNSSVLNILSNTFDSDIYMVSDKFHKECLMDLYDFEKLSWGTFEYTGDKELKKKYIPFKLIREVVLALRLFFKAKKNKAEFIFFFSSYPFTQVFLNCFAALFNQKIILCQHGDLGVLSIQKPSVLTKIFGDIQKFFYKYRSKNSIILFYGESIKKVFFEKFPLYNNDNIISIDHPYNYDLENHKRNKLINKKIVFSALGTGLINKNSHKIFSLAHYFKNEILNNKILFRHVGNMSKDVQSYNNNLVDLYNEGFVDRTVFENEILKADFFLYFFEQNSLYDLCPSGTFFDAIKYERPIIALENPFFRYYFEKLGDIGWLFNNLEEMEKFIKDNLLENEDLNKFILPIKEQLALSKHKLSIEEIERDFVNQISRLC